MDAHVFVQARLAGLTALIVGICRTMYPTPDKIVAAGKPAPDFELKASPTQTVRVSGLHGRPVVLAFYPADFSPVCTDQLSLYQTAAPAFAKYDAQVLGISTDGVWCHQAFVQQRGLKFTPAAWRLAALLSQDGGMEELIRRANDGDASASWHLAEVLAQDSDINGLVARINTGDQHAVDLLPATLAELGRHDEALHVQRFGLNADGSFARPS